MTDHSNDTFVSVWVNATHDRWAAARALRTLADAVETDMVDGLALVGHPAGADMSPVQAFTLANDGTGVGHWWAARRPDTVVTVNDVAVADTVTVTA